MDLEMDIVQPDFDQGCRADRGATPAGRPLVRPDAASGA